MLYRKNTYLGGEQMERIKDKQKKEPIKAPIKIDKESARKSLINFRQSLKKKKATSKGDD